MVNTHHLVWVLLAVILLVVLLTGCNTTGATITGTRVVSYCEDIDIIVWTTDKPAICDVSFYLDDVELNFVEKQPFTIHVFLAPKDAVKFTVGISK